CSRGHDVDASLGHSDVGASRTILKDMRRLDSNREGSTTRRVERPLSSDRAARPGPGAIALLIVLLAVAGWMRAQVIAHIPSFFGPGDPAIYFQMGRAILRHGVPRVDFMHHFLTLPPRIAHIEDYYEPAFGYLVAVAMLLRGQTPAGGAALSWIFGLLG